MTLCKASPIIPAAMSSAPWLNVGELARGSGSWRGVVPVGAFERLGAFVGDDGAGVEAELDFEFDAGGRLRVSGTCRVTAAVCCSRCLETAPVAVVAAVDYRVVASEAEAQALTPAVDTVVGDIEAMPATALVEDDLLLSMPEIACREQDSCPRAPAALETGADAGQSASPFAALKALKAGSADGVG